MAGCFVFVLDNVLPSITHLTHWSVLSSLPWDSHSLLLLPPGAEPSPAQIRSLLALLCIYLLKSLCFASGLYVCVYLRVHGTSWFLTCQFYTLLANLGAHLLFSVLRFWLLGFVL